MDPDPLPRSRRNCNSLACEDQDKPLIGRRCIITGSAAALVTGGSGILVSAEAADVELEPIDQPHAADRMAFIERAFEMRQQAVNLGDQAFGAVVVRDNVIVGQSWSRVVLDGDPTAHAEMAAIRDAARRTGNGNLGGTVLYSSSRPCPMCEAAAYWAGIDELIYGRTMNSAGPPVLCR